LPGRSTRKTSSPGSVWPGAGALDKVPRKLTPLIENHEIDEFSHIADRRAGAHETGGQIVSLHHTGAERMDAVMYCGCIGKISGMAGPTRCKRSGLRSLSWGPAGWI